MRSFRPRFILLVCALGVLPLAQRAEAGVVDHPLPTLADGKRGKHVFTVPGVVKSVVLATAVTCTSLEKTKNLAMAVEVFDTDGTFLKARHSVLAVGVTRTMSFGETTFGGLTSTLVSSNRPRSARVVASSNKLTCVALALQRQSAESLPSVAWRLPVVAKTTQKGD